MSYENLFPPPKGGSRFGNKPPGEQNPPVQTVKIQIPGVEPDPELAQPTTEPQQPQVKPTHTQSSIGQASVKQKINAKPLLFLLVGLGIVLEVYFYYFRFVSDGTNQLIAIIASIALTGFLLVASQHWAKPIGKALTISLAVYSVIATSSGQAYSLAELETQSKVAEVQREVAEGRRRTIENTIEALQSDLERIDQSIGATVNSLEDRFEWKNTLATAEEQRAETIAEIDRQSQALLDLSATAGAQYTTPNVYVYYSELLGIPARSIALVLQTMFSVFIAALAPFTLAVLRSKQGETK